MTAIKLPISYKDITEAAKRIKGAVSYTPATHSKTLSAITGANIFMKFEIFQYTAAYKERGALNRLLTLSDEEKKNGVIAMSAGNHAQGVSYHAHRLGIPATIVMPKGTPFNKIKRTEELGARVILKGATLGEASEAAKELADTEGLFFLHPFDDPIVMAGQGTVGLEFMQQVPELDIIIVPIGGGGLISGIATAAKHIKPGIKIIGVQSESYPSMVATLNGETIIEGDHTIAEGIAVKYPGMLTREVVRELVDDILIVPESRIEEAIILMMEIEKVIIEGAAATGLAALMEYPSQFKGKNVGLVLTGGNIDSRILSTCIMRGLNRDGRIARLRITLPDQPGSLASVSNVVAEHGANVMEVKHSREYGAVSLKYTELEVVVETKDRAHTEDLIRGLENAGFEVRETPTV